MKKISFVKRLFGLLGLFVCVGHVNAQTIYAEESANYDNVKTLKIEGSFCDVEIIAGKMDMVKFDGIIKGSSSRKKDFKINHRLSGDILKVWIESPNYFRGNLQGKLKFEVPEDLALDLSNSSGDVYCHGLVSDITKIRASSGDISVRNIKGDVNIVTTSGDISVKEMIGELRLESSSGDQEMHNITGDITTRATSGEINLERIVGDVNSRTSSGDLEVIQLEGSMKNISTSGNLRISNSKAILQLSASSGDMIGRNLLLLGESFFTTTSGNVRMNLNNDFEQLSFDLKASSGDLQVGKKSADDLLFVKKGELWIHGRSSSGDQQYQ